MSYTDEMTYLEPCRYSLIHLEVLFRTIHGTGVLAAAGQDVKEKEKSHLSYLKILHLVRFRLHSKVFSLQSKTG